MPERAHREETLASDVSIIPERRAPFNAHISNSALLSAGWLFSTVCRSARQDSSGVREKAALAPR